MHLLLLHGRRFLILSKVDESVEIEGKKYNLYTNICKDYISEGYQYLSSFEKDFLPIFTYQIEDVTIKKVICMEYQKNSVCILYKVQSPKKDVKITLAPVINFRDFHSMNTEHEFELKQEIKDRKAKIVLDGNAENPIYIYTSSGKYQEHIQDSFKNMFYLEEEKRGFFPEENHCVPGRYEIEISAGEEKEITFICSLEENIEEIDAKEVINTELKRLNEIIIKTELTEKYKGKISKEILRDFIVATDNFVVFRQSFGLHTILAGYPWFLDWGRDTLISLEGILLVTKRYDIAKEVLETMIRDVKFGLVPNGYSGFDNRPLYNSVDSSLLLLEQVKKYLKYTNDEVFVKEKIYPVLKKIIENYKKGIDLDENNIYLDTDGLLVSGTEKTQNTWMDAKYGDFAFTPRNGKAVEINSLWYNSLKIMEEFSKLFETKAKAKKYEVMAENCKIAFEEKFYNSKRKCLYDVIGDKKIRPNQLFSLSLSYPVIDPCSKIGNEIWETVTKKLLNDYGLKTLAKGEDNYIEVYEGNPFKRDMSYHQGITWPWLLGLYYDAFKNRIQLETNKEEKKKKEIEYQKFLEKTKTTFEKALYEYGMVGSISELYDSKAPFLPKGAPAQSWSVAEIFRILLEK